MILLPLFWEPERLQSLLKIVTSYLEIKYIQNTIWQFLEETEEITQTPHFS